MKNEILMANLTLTLARVAKIFLLIWILYFHLNQFFWWMINTDFTVTIWSSDISFYNNWTDYTPLTNPNYYCIYYRNPQYIYGVAYLPHFFILWYPMWSLFQIPYWGYIIEIYIIEALDIACLLILFSKTWKSQDPIDILALILGVSWIFFYGMCLNVEFIIFVVYFLVFKNMKAQPTNKSLVLSSFIVSLFSFKIFSLFFLPIFMARIKNNWKRLSFLVLTIVFIILLNLWFLIMCYSHYTNPYYVQDFFDNNPFQINRDGLISYLLKGDISNALLVLKFTLMLRPSSSYPLFVMAMLIIDWLKTIKPDKIIFGKICIIANWFIVLIVFLYMLFEIQIIYISSSILCLIWGFIKYKEYKKQIKQEN